MLEVRILPGEPKHFAVNKLERQVEHSVRDRILLQALLCRAELMSGVVVYKTGESAAAFWGDLARRVKAGYGGATRVSLSGG